MADYSSAPLAEEVTELCFLMRTLISHQKHLECDISQLAREVGNLDWKASARNPAVAE